MPSSFLTPIGVYGFEPVEPVILASLVTGDPLLLIGPCGTGKTFLLNSLSEALGLEHRHYNASLIAFDDLVGFPYPDEGRTEVRYLETPSTVWGAESVLVDEINRCRPEHQNRLFSLIHERRIQGMKLEHLRYRWAAMNPASIDQRPGDTYTGAEPLDIALADRFGFIVDVADWEDLSDDDKDRITDPRGDGLLSDDGGSLREALTTWRATYDGLLADPPPAALGYARRVCTLLGQAGFRMSPRRARQLARSLLGVAAIREGLVSEKDALLTLKWSLPHRAWGKQPDDSSLQGAHRIAWDACFADDGERWIHDFLAEPTPAGRIRRLLQAPDRDTASIAVARALSSGRQDDQVALAFALYPAVLAGAVDVGGQGLSDLGRVAQEVLTVSGEITWQDRLAGPDSDHPDISRLSRILGALRGGRKERATQLFLWSVVNKVPLGHASEYERTFNEAVKVVRAHLQQVAA